MTSFSMGDALKKWSIDLPDSQCEMLDRYCQLLWQWNEQINLTRHDTYDKFVSRDVRDSLELAQLLDPNEEILDVGSGGGVPGLVVAILRPDVQVSVSESTGKKAKVLEDIVGKLGLDVTVYGERAEKVFEDVRFTSVTARAVGPLAKMLTWFKDHWPSMGRLLLIKGPRWVEERGEARHLGLLANLELRRLAAYRSTDAHAESVILGIWPKSAVQYDR